MILKLSYQEGHLQFLPTEDLENLIKSATPLQDALKSSSLKDEQGNPRIQMLVTSVVAIDQQGTRKDGSSWTGTTILLTDALNGVYKTTAKGILANLKTFDPIGFLNNVTVVFTGEEFEIQGRKAMKLSVKPYARKGEASA